MSSTIKIILPSKGRLRESLTPLLKRAGLPITQETRRYVDDSQEGFCTIFLHPADIPQVLQKGSFHLGITGLDLVMEKFLGNLGGFHHLESTQDGSFAIPVLHNHSDLLLLLPLSVGKSHLELIVPQCWQDVSDLNDFREVAMDFKEIHGRFIQIATKFPHLTVAFLKKNGCLDYTLVYSRGATEAAPQIGMADIIVDLVSTGKTLESNGLKKIDGGTILKSEAILIAATGAPWTEDSVKKVIESVSKLEAENQERKILLPKSAIKKFLMNNETRHHAG